MSLARGSRSPEMLRRSASSCSNLSKRAQPFSVFSRQVLVSIATGRLDAGTGATTTVVWPLVIDFPRRVVERHAVAVGGRHLDVRHGVAQVDAPPRQGVGLVEVFAHAHRRRLQQPARDGRDHRRVGPPLRGPVVRRRREAGAGEDHVDGEGRGDQCRDGDGDEPASGAEQASSGHPTVEPTAPARAPAEAARGPRLRRAGITIAV